MVPISFGRFHFVAELKIINFKIHEQFHYFFHFFFKSSRVRFLWFRFWKNPGAMSHHRNRPLSLASRTSSSPIRPSSPRKSPNQSRPPQIQKSKTQRIRNKKLAKTIHQNRAGTRQSILCSPRRRHRRPPRPSRRWPEHHREGPEFNLHDAAERPPGPGFKNFLQNFGDESQFWRFWWFWYRLQNFEKILWRVFAYIGTNFSKFWLSNFGGIAKLW